ncbi:MAG: pyridoxamine 5'-phosphate oxidase family protein [Chloroflexi bacterium]|nr:pyridoxamine 5'-phosphate oxidase family protein [Chloroflexota bacterium]
MARVARIAWCSAATVDTRGRPRQRILHPIWEGSTGWIATGRHSLKERHLARAPYLALSYWDPQHQQVYVECAATWDDDAATKLRVWNLYKSTPPPLGYDPQMIWRDGPHDPTYGLLKLVPWRIELSALGDMMTGSPPRVWRPSP